MSTTKTVDAVVEKLMQTLEHSTKEEDISTPMSEKFNLGFEAFGESDLAKMKEESQKWLFAQSKKAILIGVPYLVLPERENSPS